MSVGQQFKKTEQNIYSKINIAHKSVYFKVQTKMHTAYRPLKPSLETISRTASGAEAN